MAFIYRKEILQDIALFTSTPKAQFYDKLFKNLDLSCFPDNTAKNGKKENKDCRVLISNCVNDQIRQESSTTAFVIISIKSQNQDRNLRYSIKFCVKAVSIRQREACKASMIWDFLLIAMLPRAETVCAPQA